VPDFEPLTAPFCRVGESPVWDDRRGWLFFTDIPAKALHAIDGSGAVLTWPVPSEAGSLGLCESGRVLVALRDGVAFLDPGTGGLEPLAAIEADDPTTRLNDGKVGPDGAFRVWSIDDGPERKPVGALYRVTGDGIVERKAEGFRVGNGVAFSPDGRTLYAADTRGPWIDRWTLDPMTGAISGRRRFADLDKATNGEPDGGAVDAEGCYWSAALGAARINRFAPDGRLLSAHPVPTANPTMPAFGGPSLRTLYVTSLRRPTEDLATAPLAGSVFAAAAPVTGLAVTRFRDG